MDTRIAVVDDQNRFLRWDDRHTVHTHQLPHRSVHVMVFDRAGRTFLQRRHRTKLTYPNHWDNSVAGHVEACDYPAGPDERLDEVYRSVAAREMLEELGAEAPLEELGSFSPEPGVHYEHFRLYRAYHEGPFTLQAAELEEARWFTRPELGALLNEGREPVTRLLGYLLRWMEARGVWG